MPSEVPEVRNCLDDTVTVCRKPLSMNAEVSTCWKSKPNNEEPVSIARSEKLLPKNKPKLKFDLHYLPVGKFGLKITKSPASKDLRIRNTTQESDILVGHQQFLKSATQKFCGENRREVNSFTKIPVYTKEREK